MNQIIIEGLELVNLRFQVKDIDEAIDKLQELKQQNKNRNHDSIHRFKGIVKSSETNEEEWYFQ